MYSPEFRTKALRIVDECGGSCAEASRRIGIVSSRTLWRWRDERKKRPRKRYAHLNRSQKMRIAGQIGRGASARALSDRYGVSITTIYNIRNEYRRKGALSFMDRKEKVVVPAIEPSDLPNDVEELKRRCAELELENAILEQTVKILKKTQAPTRRI